MAIVGGVRVKSMIIGVCFIGSVVFDGNKDMVL